jgi:hypothetical protein
MFVFFLNRCANKPGSNLAGLENYECLLWNKKDDARGNLMKQDILLFRSRNKVPVAIIIKKIYMHCAVHVTM